MMRTKIRPILLILVTLILAGLAFEPPVAEAIPAMAVQAPVLKWQNGGCYSSGCETGWYASPAVADLDNDGTKEVIGATYSLFVLNGEDGSEQWTADPAGSRVWPGVVVADINEDNDLEIVIAAGGGNVSVFDHEGNFEPGWPQNPGLNEFRSMAVDDLEGDGDLEIVVGQARLDRINVWVLEHNGTIRPGWPQITTVEGSAAGLYNDNIGLGDLDGDGELEIVVPSDVITIVAYEPDGSSLPTHPMYHDHPGHDMDYWGEVPAYIDLAYETRGWGPCYTEFTPRANFADGPANIVDVNGDGINEVVVIGDVHNCNTSPYTDLYNTPYILNLDRTRFNVDGYDWTTPPINTGAPVIQNYNIIESVQPNPVTVDLDGDGELEILFPSYDGALHAFWLDKSEHGNWPYRVYNPGEGFYRFASEPVVADLDDSGHPEVIFSSWVQKGTYRTGKLHILDYLGNLLHEIELPGAYGSPDWNGAMAAPTLSDIDGDPDLEVVLTTAHSGIVAYDLPGTEKAVVLWETGRGNVLRTGSSPYRSLAKSVMFVSDFAPDPGDTLTYTLVLLNPGPMLEGVTVTNTLPTQLTFAGNLTANRGTVQESGGVITWDGGVSVAATVVIQYDAVVDSQIVGPEAIINVALIDGGIEAVFAREASVMVNGIHTFLPFSVRDVP